MARRTYNHIVFYQKIITEALIGLPLFDAQQFMNYGRNNASSVLPPRSSRC